MTDSLRPPRPAHDRVLVTGAAGFIGSRVVPLLTGLGVEVVALDDLSVGMPLPAAAPGLVSIVADIRDRDTIAAIIAEHRPQAIVHLAAVHHIPTCEAKPALAFDVNIMGTQSLLDAAQAAGVRDVLLASSGAVYQWESGPLDEERTLLKASDVYSITKLANEAQVAGWAGRSGGRAIAARLFNTIGTNDPNGHLIPDILAQVARGGASVEIRLGNTAPKRDYIFVDDVASGLVTLLGGFVEGREFEAFNLCSGREASVADLVALIGELMNAEVVIATDPARVRKIDRLQQLGDPAKLADRLGWHAAWTLRDALAQIMTATGYLASDAPRAAA